MYFLISLLLPVFAVVLFFRSYPDRAARGQVPAQLGTASALSSGAIAGAAALGFLALVGAVLIAYRGKTLTPEGMSPALFWGSQLALTAALGAAVGALSALALLPWVRSRLAALPAPGA